MLELEKVSKTWLFPGGEVGLALTSAPDFPKDLTLLANIHNSDDLIKVILALNAYKTNYEPIRKLIIPYFPYARQDRSEGSTPIATQAIARMLDGLVDHVLCLDVHSSVTPACFRHSSFVSLDPYFYLERYLLQILEVSKYTQATLEELPITYVFPDDGAYKRYTRLHKLNFIKFSKARDPETGKLTKFRLDFVSDDKKPIYSNLVVVDDICDGGATFLGVGELLKSMFLTPKLHLFTAHGIYSKGVEDLLKIYSTLGRTDSHMKYGAYLDNSRVITIPFKSQMYL